MNYHIVIRLKEGEKRTASFVNEHDRDSCLDMFADTYDDCIFRAVYDEGE